MCNRHRRSRGFTIFIWLYDLQNWHKVTSHKDGVNAPVDIGGHIACEGTDLWTFSKSLKVTCTRLVNLMMGASLPCSKVSDASGALENLCYGANIETLSAIEAELWLIRTWMVKRSAAASGWCSAAQAAEAAVAARSRLHRAWPSEAVYKSKPREILACYIERVQRCCGCDGYCLHVSTVFIIR